MQEVLTFNVFVSDQTKCLNSYYDQTENQAHWLLKLRSSVIKLFSKPKNC